MTLRLLDLFAGAGGCSAGYMAAGFHVTAVDNRLRALRANPAPARVVADAMDVLAGRVIDLDAYDVIHASPPCQHYSQSRHVHDVAHPDLVPATLDALRAWQGGRTDRAWIVENVPGAPLPGALVLCGSEFGLRAHDPRTDRVLAVKRHRLFASSVDLWGAGGCTCAEDRARGRIAGVYGGGSVDPVKAKGRGGYTPSADVARALLRVPWMSLEAAQQCIPPVYAQHVGEQVRDALLVERAA